MNIVGCRPNSFEHESQYLILVNVTLKYALHQYFDRSKQGQSFSLQSVERMVPNFRVYQNNHPFLIFCFSNTDNSHIKMQIPCLAQRSVNSCCQCFFLVFSSLQKSFSSADRDATGLKLIVCTYAKMRCRKVESI